MSADSYVMCYFKGKYTTLFCKCIRTKKKSYMSWIFGYLDVLVMIGLGIRQGFEGEELRVGYKTADRSHPKIKQKKESLEDFSSKLSIKEGGYLLSRIALQYHRRKRA